MKKPLISVIVPLFNHERFVGRCVESLLAQTYTNWELVVVDDGSTDGSADVVRGFHDPRISYVYQENRGVGALATTINVGLARTTGELVTMLPSDDTWPPYRLERQIPLFSDPRVVLCFGRGQRIDEDDNVIEEFAPPLNLATMLNRPLGTALRGMMICNYVAQPTVLIRRTALERIGGYLQPQGLLAEDYPTHMALALEGEFRYQDLSLCNYRMHAGQMTKNHLLRMIQTDVAYVSEFFRSLTPEIQERTGWNEASLERALSHRLRRTYAAIGRKELVAKNWKKARSLFIDSMRYGDLRTKVKSVVGIVCSLLHIDMERVLPRFHRRLS